MAVSVNECIFCGYVSGEPKVGFTSKGNKYVSFQLAVGRPKIAGKEDIKADYFYVTLWNKQAEHGEDIVRKGEELMVIGSVNINRTEKNGTWYTNVNIVPRTVRPIAKSMKPMSVAEAVSSQEAETVFEDDGLPY